MNRVDNEMESELYSRQNDPRMVECEDCGWRGQAKECIHTYNELAKTGGDVEAAEECPKCNSQNLADLNGCTAIIARRR